MQVNCRTVGKAYMAGEILSSTGSLGLEYRSFDRLYLNWRGGVVDDLTRLDRWAGIAASAMENGLTSQSGDVSRCVGRFLVSADGMAGISQFPNLRTHIEAAVPVDPTIVMVLFGFNHVSRRPLLPVDEMIVKTAGLSISGLRPIDRIFAAQDRGLRFISDIRPEDMEPILSLWQSTFGWSGMELTHLSRRLASQIFLPPEKRSVWFSGLFSGTDVVSLATAERLTLPVGDGNQVHIIESTEWRTRKDAGRQGFGAATVSHLHTQVIDDMERGNEPYVIIAETNYLSGAYRLGNGSALRIPMRQFNHVTIPQILVQNVAVGDGLAPQGLRDFIMMYLDDESKRIYYSPAMRRAVLERSTV